MNLLWVLCLCCVFCGSHVTAESVATIKPPPSSSSVVMSEMVSATIIANYSAHPATSASTPIFSASENHSIYLTTSPSANMSSTTHYSISPTIVSSSATSQNVSSLTITVVPTNHSTSQIMPTSSHHIVPTISPSGSVNSTAAVMTSTVIPTSSPNGTVISSTAVMTSAVMPTSSVAPPPTPAPPFGNYSVKENGTACLLASFSVKFAVVYFNKTNKEKVTARIPLPDEHKVNTNGFCQHQSQEGDKSFISLTWPAVDPKYNFSITFATEKRNSGGGTEPEGSWSAILLELNINTTDNDDFRDAEAQEITVGRSGLVDNLNAKYGHAARCNHQITVSGLKNSKKTVNATVSFDSLEIQPFEVPKSGKFGEADDCKMPTPKPSATKKSNNTVAIAVGCTLAGLVVIVLIGYFIGRRRSATKTSAGYRKL